MVKKGKNHDMFLTGWAWGRPKKKSFRLFKKPRFLKLAGTGHHKGPMRKRELPQPRYLLWGRGECPTRCSWEAGGGGEVGSPRPGVMNLLLIGRVAEAKKRRNDSRDFSHDRA